MLNFAKFCQFGPLKNHFWSVKTSDLENPHVKKM